MTDIALARIGALWRWLDGLRLRLDWPVIFILLIPALAAIFDPANLGEMVSIAVGAFLHTLPFILFAVAAVAFLKATSSERIVAKAFEGSPVRMVVMAALVGGLAPFCSCEVIPFIAALLALGAPLAAVMAFWLASPLMDPPTLFITAGALGWDFAIGKTIAAVGVGLFGGFSMMALMRLGVFADPLRPRSSGGCCSAKPAPQEIKWRFWEDADRRETFRETAFENAIFLIKWLGFAYVIQAVLILYMPAEVVGAAVGGSGAMPIITGALVGMPAYLNGYAAPALLEGLLQQGMSNGAAMAFLTAGAVSCIPAMAAVWSLVKRPVFVAYVAFGFIGAVLSGAIFGLIV